ncbi:MAG: M23 family metallopeptidase [Fibrobacteria bacterium]|nr:M23 family metallopeptidase [Fibrobacteria bacterium]
MQDKAILKVQAHTTANTTFYLVTPFKKFLFLSSGFILFCGLLCLLFSIGYSSYNYVTLSKIKTKNKQLKSDLNLLANQLQTLNTQLVSIAQTEETLRICYGLSSETGFAGYATGGQRNSDEMFMELVSPLQRKFSQINYTSKALNYNMKATSKQLSTLENFLSYQKNIWDHTPSIKPASGRYTSNFGYRIHPVHQIRSFHFGLDIANEPWTPVKSSANGRIVDTGNSHSFGKFVTVDHGNGIQTKYAHLSQYNVKEGQLVERYEVLGHMGATGITTGTHLHYEIIDNNIAINPKTYILPTSEMVD